ncbi:hypothetical protein J2X76_006317 [Neorhizobium sp. 2083]|uniref:hypothetical protein n=1 Tax=Neorhizobium sp. 2083 TaxID=2817762 RepID=UPI0028595042|nr:hypothetical protein [Neorhizobium sp. 2083]MDR6821116.1 hypothetical protein [Neorhizobium sp. 2083]
MLVAAYLFVFQLVLGSLALANAAANAMPVDVFGNPLCISHIENKTDTDHKDGSKPLECCTQACSMFAPLLAPQTVGQFIGNPLKLVGEPLRVERYIEPLDRPETKPGSPRAPPFGI